MLAEETVFFVPAKTTYKDADRRGPGGDRKAPWFIRQRDVAGIGIESAQSSVQGEVSPSRATKGLSGRPPPLRSGNSPSATAHWAVRFLWKPSDASSLIWPLTHHPKPKGLGDCLYMGFSFESRFLCKVGFRPHRRPRGFPIVRLRFAPETRLRRLPTGQFVSFGNLRMQVVLFGLDPSLQT